MEKKKQFLYWTEIWMINFQINYQQYALPMNLNNGKVKLYQKGLFLL